MDTPFEPENRSTDKYLFHYTSVETLLDYILPSQTLRLSPMSEVNDPKESKFSVNAFYGGGGIDAIRTLHTQWRSFYHSRVKAACFSCDDPSIAIRGTEHMFHGWAKPTMWAHYADNHKGVCVAFRRQSLLNAFENSFASASRIFYGKVNYQEIVSISEDYEERRFALHKAHIGAEELENNFDSFVLDYIDKFHEEIYFRKHGDWSSENEYRLLMVSEKDGFEYLDYGDSIAGVCSGFDMQDWVRTAVITASEAQKIPHMRLYAQNFT
jgi:hypothetical protein